MRPAIDFDLNSPFAYFYTLGVMCNWSPDRHRRARANLAPGVMGAAVGSMVPLMKHLVELAKQGVPSSGMLRQVATEYLEKEFLVEEILRFSRTVATGIRDNVPGIPHDMDDEEIFWRFLQIPKTQHRLTSSDLLLGAIPWNELITPGDGLGAMGMAPGIDVIDSEIDATLKSDASLAGQLLVIVATLDMHHSTLSASVNRASYVLESKRVMGQRARTMRHIIKTWTKWQAVAPLWAGAIVVSNDRGGGDLFQVIADDESRNRALAIAKWFGTFASQHKADRAPEPLIPAAKVIQMPESLVPERPDLCPLDGTALEEATSYRAATRKHFER